MSADDDREKLERYAMVSQLVPKGVWTDAIYNEVFPHVVERTGFAYDREYKVPRWSVIISDCQKSAVIKDRQVVEPEVVKNSVRLDGRKGRGNYGSLPVISWDLTPNIRTIKEHLEKHIPGLKITVCLAHFYNDGNHHISWHSDSEATDPPRDIFSVSIGTTRKFRFRKKGQTRGWIAEYLLDDGMMVHMKPGCQERYEHVVPKQTRVKTWRINLTFRY